MIIPDEVVLRFIEALEELQFEIDAFIKELELPDAST